MKLFHIYIVFFFIPFISHSQSKLKGYITQEENQPVLGANIYWLNTSVGTTSNMDGFFEISYKPSNKKLIISYVGYKTDTLVINSNETINHKLTPTNQLNEVTIKNTKKSIQKSYFDTHNVFTVNKNELLKAACCNLSESFETNPSIDVHFTDALTGTKQIKMLGLKSPYLLITQENIPTIRGAAQAYGLTFIPGTWIESIQITKGAGSVINGFESISGQINTELVKPAYDKKLFVNLYNSASGRIELNTHFNKQVSNKWYSGLYIHSNYRNKKIDNNSDTFLDSPLSKQINILNRWQLVDNTKGWVSFINLKFLKDEKQTGQTFFNPKQDKGTTNAWGSEINTTNFESSVKVGYVFPEIPYQSFGMQLAYSNNKQNSYFGLKTYDISHQNFYSNFLFNSIISNTKNKFTTGINFNYDQISENVLTENYDRTDYSAGAFFEYAFDNLDNFSLTAGLRVDFHNKLNTFLTPRLHLRYSPWEKAVLRASVGKGKRIANIFAENQQLFGTNRTINILNSDGDFYGLKAEKAWNFGLSFLQGFTLFNRTGDVSLDFYKTNFSNQIIVDWENPEEISFYNLDGKSYADNIQFEINYSPFNNFHIKTAYKNYNVVKNYNSGKKQEPLQAKNRFFTNISYNTNEQKNGALWKFDVTLQNTGKQRLPDTSVFSNNYQLPNYSKSFNTVNTQITKVFSKQFEVYAGSENLTNYKQHNPIIEAENPFGEYFDSSIIYAPVLGRNLYAGLRFQID